MERQSDKHGPRVDEEMKRETDSLTQGAPVESRAQESREKEGPGDGQPTPDEITSSGAERVPPGGIGYDELELRQDLARFLEGSIFPATRSEVLANARKMNAPQRVVKYLEALPDRHYSGFPEVWTALGGRVEGDRGQR